MTIKFTLNGKNIDVEFRNNVYYLKYPCNNDFVNCYPYFARLPPKCYKFEVWGAEGGTGSGYNASKGGYSYGSICLKTFTDTYFYIGAKGESVGVKRLSRKSFNGGGAGFNYDHDFDSSGGGASDIRFLENDLKNRVIVAGGAGGSGFNVKFRPGGSGGGDKGEDGLSGERPGLGASLTTYDTHVIVNKKVPSFGIGGGYTSSSVKGVNGCGGGGGWYGGGGGLGYSAGGGGGSGFVFNLETLNKISGLNLNNLPSNFLLRKADTINGNNPHVESFGNGMIRITILTNYTHIVNTLSSFVFFFIGLIISI